MIRNIVTFIFIGIIFLYSCASHKNTTPSDVDHTLLNTTSLTDSSYFVVSFYSRGGGVARDTKMEFIKYIDSIIPLQAEKIIYEEKKWGREGEINYCFDMSLNSEDQKSTFQKNIRDSFQGKKLVRIFMAIDCK
jgi:hypothetical protein